MTPEQKKKEIGDAMDQYKIAVLRGLKQDHIDPCWRKAILVMPWLFDERTVKAAKAFMRKAGG